MFIMSTGYRQPIPVSSCCMKLWCFGDPPCGCAAPYAVAVPHWIPLLDYPPPLLAPATGCGADDLDVSWIRSANPHL